MKIWQSTMLSVATVGLAVAGFGFYLLYPSIQTPEAPRFPPPTDKVQAYRQDLEYLKKTLHVVDRSFSVEAWRAFDLAITELSIRADQLDDPSFEFEIARSVALAKNGHTNVLGASRGLTLNSIPVRFYWFADGLHVVKTDPAHADLLGARVVRVAEQTPDEIVQLFRPYVGGTASLARELSIYFMESPQGLHAASLQALANETIFELETTKGKVIQRSISGDAIPASGPQPAKTVPILKFDPRELIWPRRELSSVPLPAQAVYPLPVNDGRRWAHVLDGKPLSLSLQNPNRFYWSDYLGDGKFLYLQLNALMDEPGREPLETFLHKTIQDAAKRDFRFAIVDLRSNPGGSYLIAANFARELPQVLRGDGKVFILTGGNTFSAAIVTAARLKYYAGARGMIVGEPIGDTPQFWAEAATRIVLPNSGLRIGYATGFHDWENGCSLDQIFSCYPMNYVYGVAAGSLEPTRSVVWSFADYVDGKDTVIQQVMQLAASH